MDDSQHDRNLAIDMLFLANCRSKGLPAALFENEEAVLAISELIAADLDSKLEWLKRDAGMVEAVSRAVNERQNTTSDESVLKELSPVIKSEDKKRQPEIRIETALDADKILAEQFLPIDEEELDRSYQAATANTGAKKAKRYEEFLKGALDSAPTDYGFLSIGGADGSEIDYVAKAIGIKEFLLCDSSEDAGVRGRELSEKLSGEGVHLKVFNGDIWEKRDAIRQHIKSRNLDRIVVSAQSVLHELPTRSKQSDFKLQFFDLLNFASETIFVSSDPSGELENVWPEEVLISCKNLDEKVFFSLASFVHQQFFADDFDKPTLIPGQGVYCHQLIALETFYKTVHMDGETRFKHEMGECLSLFPVKTVRDILSANGYSVATSKWQSERLLGRFNTSYSVKDLDSSNELPLPPTFIGIFASKRVKETS